MQRWTYSQYKASVRDDIEHALTKLGFHSGAAIGFAYNELALRLEEYPEEITLALVALGNEARGLNVLQEDQKENDFIDEILEHLRPHLLSEAGEMLPDEDRTVFASDAEVLTRALGDYKPGCSDGCQPETE